MDWLSAVCFCGCRTVRWHEVSDHCQRRVLKVVGCRLRPYEVHGFAEVKQMQILAGSPMVRLWVSVTLGFLLIGAWGGLLEDAFRSTFSDAWFFVLIPVF